MEQRKKTEISLLAVIALVLAALMFVGHVYGSVRTVPEHNVVRISKGHPDAYSGGSGFIMGDGYLITAKHVVVDCNSVDFYINYYDGKNEKVTEKQIRLSDSTDLAEIKIKRNYGRTLRVVSYPLTRGEPIYLAGHPWEKRTLFLSRGIVSSEREWFTFYGGGTIEGRMLDAHVVSGCSGCPVFTEYDYVAGVAVGVGGMITIMVDNMDLLEFISERE